MAGLGKRMRPHTLSQPKPLIPVAGTPIVYRLVEDIARMCDENTLLTVMKPAPPSRKPALASPSGCEGV